MQKIICVLALVLSISASSAFADTTTTGVVESVEVTLSGHIYFELENAPSLCTSPSSSLSEKTGHFQTYYYDADVRKMFLSVLLAAHLAGKTVDVIAYDDASVTYGCKIKRFKVRN